MMKYEFLQQVPEQQIKHIEDWLINEQNISKEGFYCNWKIIHKSIHEKKCCCISVNHEIIGFLVWQHSGRIVRIDIMEVRPDWRGKKAGKYLVKCCLSLFRDKGFLVANLECSPPSSEHFWKKMGFINFYPYEATGLHSGNRVQLRLYKPLLESCEDGIEDGSLDVIELWDMEPYQVKQHAPKWIWNVTYENNSERLVKPIIYPSEKDWKIRWRKGEIVYQEKKVKYFLDSMALDGNFIVVQELPIEYKG